MKIQVKKKGQSAPKRTKKNTGTSANQLKKLMTNSEKIPGAAQSLSVSNGLKRFPTLPFKRINPNGVGKKTETIWHMRNVKQTLKVDTKKITPEDTERSRTIKAISMRLQDIDVPEITGIIQNPVTFDEIFDVLGLDEAGEERKENQLDTNVSEVKVDLPEVNVPEESLFSDLKIDLP
ncbi:uncharacterized protein LOC110185220 [Drosophila serrata]|uniref:uncharacterized protein LOC110185220 n=1 Tax=Drosophila serrata TaxID=7274 RepID=UPI000A1D3169|nr:uncharacterized protein LOC110185220 [Drosophila serrata]